MRQFKYVVYFGMFVKKHYCPKCSDKLSVKKIKRTVNSESEEAKDYGFTTDAGEYIGRIVGDVEFIWHVYHCANCGIEITNREMREHGREKKGKKRKSKGKGKVRGRMGIVLFSIFVLLWVLQEQ